MCKALWEIETWLTQWILSSKIKRGQINTRVSLAPILYKDYASPAWPLQSPCTGTKATKKEAI